MFERYSDSAASYVTLDASKPQVYKTLFRAAKAKLKLRLKATFPGEENETAPIPAAPSLETLVPTSVPSSLHRTSTDTLTPCVAISPCPVVARSPDVPAPPKFEPVSPVSPIKATEKEDEAPLPRSFTARQSKCSELPRQQCITLTETDNCAGFFNNLATASYNADLAFRPKPNNLCTSWVVYCNNCNHPMEDAHFHCGVCDGGDYDLCPACVDSGIHCPGMGHWMVKRFVKNGSVVNSTTERIAPKMLKEEGSHEVPGAFTDEKQSVVCDEEPTRTCNCCVKVLAENQFVTCTACDDYDLCLDCHIGNKHGHHPGHAFKAAVEDTTLSSLADFLCNAGRNVRHSAVCDGCDKFIYGVRHKCLKCPDWDYCSDCVKNAKFIHPRHRFVPIYEPLAEPVNYGNRHYGIYCDGPLCKDRESLSYIEGIRYKCAVCHDTDFCQNCEAHPSNRHNHTHPLIKFKTPVRSVNVTTVNDDKNGREVALGDRQRPQRSTATETTPAAPSTNAATQVQTIVDMKPSEKAPIEKEKIAIRNLLVDPVVSESVKTIPTAPVEFVTPMKSAKQHIPLPSSDSSNEGLDAHFIRDTILDGSKITSDCQFVQVWTLRNPGPNAWPAGCSVRHVGGDNMLNIDNTRPLSHAELADASESNVVGRTVEAGEEVCFRVVMKAPAREGTAISYWRLKTAEGMPFGHRLWCDINVVSPASPSTSTSQRTPERSSPTNSLKLYERHLQARLDKMRTAQQFHANQLEQQKMERIQRVRTAAVQRLMETRRREHEAALASMKVEQPMEKQTAELPVEEKKDPVPEPQSSGMIFPQLEKESPESSTYEPSTSTQVESPKSEKSTIARTVTVASDEEFFEDAESVALHSDDDEGFMTDEEYDILDASDEEMP